MVEWFVSPAEDETTEVSLDALIKKYVSLFVESESTHPDNGIKLRFEYEKKLESAVESTLLTPDQYRELVLPLAVYHTGEESPAEWAMCWVVEYALMHPSCPIDVLTAVCRSAVPPRAHEKPFMFPVWQYREVAALNPACPEEDRVYVALDQGIYR